MAYLGDPGTSINGPAVATGFADRTAPPPQEDGSPTIIPNRAPAPDRGAYQAMAQILRDMGLDSLMALDSNGNPSGWLWQQLVNGVDTAAELTIALEQTQQWQERFAVIVKQRQLVKEGKLPRAMTEAEVVSYEQTAQQLMRQVGLPAWMYDQPKTDFQQLMLGNISTSELADRLGESYNRVQQAPQAVRDQFSAMYGVGNGDGAMAAWFLDPDRTIAKLEVASRAAFTAGTAQTMGFSVDKGTAERVAQLGLTDQQVQSGLADVASLAPVFNETISETTDLQAGTTGIGASFLGDAAAKQQIENRVQERKARTSGPGGGAALTNQGLVGV